MAVISYVVWFTYNRTTFGKEKIGDAYCQEYYKGNDAVYYRYCSGNYLIDLGWLWGGYIPLVNKVDTIDSNTFTNIKKGKQPSQFFRDNNAIYYYGKKMDNIDVKTFEFIGYVGGTNYAKDKKFIYFPMGDKSVGIVNDADVETFEFICSDYAKDIHNVYYSDGLPRKIEGADPVSFKCEGVGYNARDNYNAYVAGKKVVGANVTNLVSIEGGYQKDTNNVYYEGVKIEGADPATFHKVSTEIFGDKNYAYQFGKRFGERIEGCKDEACLLSDESISNRSSTKWENSRVLFEYNPGELIVAERDNIIDLKEKNTGLIYASISTYVIENGLTFDMIFNSTKEMGADGGYYDVVKKKIGNREFVVYLGKWKNGKDVVLEYQTVVNNKYHLQIGNNFAYHERNTESIDKIEKIIETVQVKNY